MLPDPAPTKVKLLGPMDVPITVITAPDVAASFAARLLAAGHDVPIDIESNGLHAYRPSLCTLQIALTSAEGEVLEIAVIDPIAGGEAVLAPLHAVLGKTGPRKLVHDLAFDARILARSGLPFEHVFDTSLAARFLGVSSTSLAALVEARVGARLSKELQHHDWGKRPLTGAELPYLAADVAHLPALARSLTGDLVAGDIVDEVEVETVYRLGTAKDAQDDARPPYVRMKESAGLEPLALVVLRAVADVREEAARNWDVPPFKVMGNDVLLALAKLRPTSREAAHRVRGLDRGRGASLLGELLSAIARAVAEGDLSEDERALHFPPRRVIPRAELELRRGREHRLSAWRRAEAKTRAVDEQVVLPGHCLQELADRAPVTLDELGGIGGFGERRCVRYGEAILAAVRGSAT